MTKDEFKQTITRHLNREIKRYVRLAGPLIRDKNLWQLNCYSVATGVSVGVLCSWAPIPFHTILAVMLAIALDCNLPLAIIAIWVANPITMPAMYYYAYKLGGKILGISPHHEHFDLSIDGFLRLMSDIWEPLILGCVLLGIVSAVLVNIIIRFTWNSVICKHFIHKKHRH